jgi:hypothetical protein
VPGVGPALSGNPPHVDRFSLIPRGDGSVDHGAKADFLIRNCASSSGTVVVPLQPPGPMDDPARDPEQDEPVPLGQRLFDNVFLLLALGLLVMLGVFTAWGLWEIRTLPTATLP